MLFHDKNALLKDLRFSDLWAVKVKEWQRRVIQDRGYLGGEVTHLIHTFTFAPQRFESFCTPLFDLLIVIPAVVKMLKMIAEDWRDDVAAKRAMKALHEIDGQFILDLGLLADYGSLCLGLLRKFDVHSKDPSISRRLLRQWEQQLDSLFIEGNIFRGNPSTAAGADVGNEPVASIQKTATQIAMEQIDYIGEVDYKGRVRDFMDVSPKELFARGMRDMQSVVGPAKARMAVEFRESDLYMCMDVFSLDEWVDLLPLAATQSLLSSPGASALRLARNLRSVLDYFSSEYKTISDWVFVVAIAMRHRIRLLSERPVRST